MSVKINEKFNIAIFFRGIFLQILKLLKWRKVKNRIVIITLSPTIVIIAVGTIILIVFLIGEIFLDKKLTMSGLGMWLLILFCFELMFCSIAEVLLIPTFLVVSVIRLFKRRRRSKLMLQYAQNVLLIVFGLNFFPSLLGGLLALFFQLGVSV